MRALIDTCVIIDALQAREPFRKEAEKLFLLVANDRLEGYITAKAVTDIYYLTHRNTHSDEQARKILASLLSLFAVLDTHGSDCQNALVSSLSDYEDAVMVETGKRSHMECIVTRNTRDYSKSDIPVLTPTQLLRALEQEENMNDEASNGDIE